MSIKAQSIRRLLSQAYGTPGFAREWLTEYADLLEAREKAEPVAWVKVPAGEQASDRYPGYSFNCIECLPAGNYDLYIHPPATPTGVAEQKLASSGVFAGVDGLRGLLESDAFWSVQPYGTRLHFGEGITEYLHRDVLRAAVELLDNNQQTQAPVVDERTAFEVELLCHFSPERGPEMLLMDDGGNYEEFATMLSWEMWQARAKPGQTTDKACSAVVPDETPNVCDGKEQEAFEKFAIGEKYDMKCHPLHYLFLDEKTYAARQAWKAAIEYCRAAMLKGEK